MVSLQPLQAAVFCRYLYKPTVHTADGHGDAFSSWGARRVPQEVVVTKTRVTGSECCWRLFQSGFLRWSRQTCWLTEHANMEEAAGFSSWCHRSECCLVLMSKRICRRVQPESNLQTSSLVQDFQGSQIECQRSFRADTRSNVTLMFPLTLAAASSSCDL